MPVRLTTGKRKDPSKVKTNHRQPVKIIADLSVAMIAARECAAYELPNTQAVLNANVDALADELAAAKAWKVADDKDVKDFHEKNDARFE